MRTTHIELKNWLNFRKVGVALAESTYVIGPNAAGKSNFLDVFRFLRTLSSPSGGGLSKAVTERGGLTPAPHGDRGKGQSERKVGTETAE